MSLKVTKLAVCGIGLAASLLILFESRGYVGGIPGILLMTKSVLTPIHFYGKVVDSEGKPVEGAQSTYIVHGYDWHGSPTLQGPASSSDGTFEIMSHGLSLSVNVTHSDYNVVDRAGIQVEYDSNPHTIKPPPKPPTRDNPAIFVLRKKGVAEPLIFNDRIVAQVPTKGSEFWMDLKSGKPIKTTDSISFKLKSNYETVSINSNQPFEWHLVMQIPEGGFYERTNELDFNAPESNYLPFIKVDYVSNAPDWKGRFENEYFVKSTSGSYGRIKLLLGGNGYCVMQAWLNPKAGSRNLEFDQNKQLVPK